MFYSKALCLYILSIQSWPANPIGQSHIKLLTPSVHTPLFSHGELAQSSMSQYKRYTKRSTHNS